jgi:energy-coupling factor transporter transmembrane protein EcfT
MIMNHSNIRKVDQIDGRTVLLLAVCACFTSFLSTSLLGHGLYMIWLFLLLCYFELFTMGLGMLGVYILSVVWLAINTKYHISFPSPLLFHMLYRLLMPAMIVCLIVHIPSGKLTSSIRKLPIPENIILILIVMLRFAPTIVHEFGEVKDAMKVRGFLRSIRTVLFHPLSTLEYAVVPMVFRSLKIADELASSAIVRGIESPYKKDSYYIISLTAKDIFLVMSSTVIAVVCCRV